MVLVNVISVIEMEYMIPCSEICYLVNSLGKEIAVLYRPNS
jgi:hypothetical protein